MSSPTDDEVVKAFARRGVRAATPEAWTKQMALNAIRENRRRYAGSPALKFYEAFAAQMIETLPTVCDVDAASMSSTLMAASGQLGTFALMNPLTAVDVAQILAFVADDLDRQANGGEPS